MNNRVAIKEEIIKGTIVTLWKNTAKDQKSLTYNVTISKPDMAFISVSSIYKKDLSYVTEKYNRIIDLINFLVNS